VVSLSYGLRGSATSNLSWLVGPATALLGGGRVKKMCLVYFSDVGGHMTTLEVG